jgi:hypothetical protein
MRFKTAIVSVAMGVVLALPAASVWAASDKHDEMSGWPSSSANYGNGKSMWSWWKKDKSETRVRTVTRAPAQTWSEQRTGYMGGPTAGRIATGQDRYVWTDGRGKYDYFADRYSYPYAYGATPSAPPTGVFGYVPPQEAGGGPVMYRRPATSWALQESVGR